jgi:uncharacterized protein (TIGR00369 family)
VPAQVNSASRPAASETLNAGMRKSRRSISGLLGAFVAAMLYDTVGPTLLATLGPDQFQSTLDIHVTFLRPIRPGKVFAHGHLVHRVGDTAYLEASLNDANGDLVAQATATALVIPLDQAPTAA